MTANLCDISFVHIAYVELEQMQSGKKFSASAISYINEATKQSGRDNGIWREKTAL